MRAFSGEFCVGVIKDGVDREVEFSLLHVLAKSSRPTALPGEEVVPLFLPSS